MTVEQNEGHNQQYKNQQFIANRKRKTDTQNTLSRFILEFWKMSMKLFVIYVQHF